MPKYYFGCTAEPRCSTRAARGRCTHCKKQHADYMRQYSRVHADRINSNRRARWHTKRYGLTDEEHLELLAREGGFCHLCLEKMATVIDHDHATGKVRGVLCHFCNKGLGYIEKMPSILGILKYLAPRYECGVV